MSNLIRSEISQFIVDYLSQKDPDLIAEENGKLKHNYSRIREGIDEAFKNDKTLNPQGKSIYEYFRSSSQSELKQKLAEARERAQIKSAIPLGQWVSLAESVVTHEDESTRQEYNEMFETGLVQEQLRRNLRFDNQYEERDLQFLIHNQSGEVNRSIVEIVSNAIDFSPINAEVRVEIDEHGYQVTDLGKGMSPHNLIEELSIPFISGAREKDKASIGKFGMGFLTILRHLKNEGDQVKVETGQDGKGFAILFFFREGKVLVSIGTQQEIIQGTRISLRTSDFDQENAKHLLSSHLRYKKGAAVIVNGEDISQLEGVEFVYAGESSTERVGLGFELVEEISNSSCEVVLAINGVQIITKSVEGFNLPKRLVLDLPYKSNLSESRDAVVYDDIFVTAAKSIIDQLLQSQLFLQQKIQIVNALCEIFHAVELQAFTQDESVLEYLETQLSSFTDSDVQTIVPAKEGWQHISASELLFVNPRLEALIEPFFNKISPMVGMRSASIRGYLADIDSSAEHPILVHGDKLVFSRQLWTQLRSHPEFLQRYINFVMRDKGFIDFPRINEVSTSDEIRKKMKDRLRGMTYQEECERRILDERNIVDGYLLEMVFHPKHLFTDEFEDLRYDYPEWIDQLTLGEEFRAELEAYIFGESDTFAFKPEWLSQAIEQHRLVQVKKMPESAVIESVYNQIMALADRKDEIIEGFKKYKEVIAFFLPENVQKYLDLPPDQIEQQFCSDFIDIYRVAYEQEIQQVIKYKLKWMRRNWDEEEREPTEEDIEYNFSFLLSVIREVLNDNDSYSMEEKEKSFAETIPAHARFPISRMISAMIARTHYLQVKSQLDPNYHQAYDALFSFRWTSSLANPDELLRYPGSSKHNEVEENLLVMQGMSRVAQTVPLEQIEDLVSVFTADPKISVSDIYPLLTFLVDPYVTYHTVAHGSGWSSETDKLENLPLAIVQELRGVDLVRSYFDRGGKAEEAFAWRYRYTDIKTFEDFEQVVREKWEIARSQFPNLVQKYQAIYGNEKIQKIFEQREEDVRKAYSDAMSSQSYTEYESFSVVDAMLYTEGCFAPLSDRKLQTILKIVDEKFDPHFMDRKLCAQFAMYLRRVLSMTHMSDDEFENLQGWFLIKKQYNNWHVFLKDFFAEPIVNVIRKKQALVGKQGMDRVADIWCEVVDSLSDFTRGKSDEEVATYVSRLIDIVEDIMRKPKFLQDFIFKTLETTGNTYNRYSCFYSNGKNSTQLISLIQPYVIYFNQGERTTLDSQSSLFSEALNKGEHSLLLSDLMHHRRTRSKNFKDDLSSPNDLPEKVQYSSEGRNKFVYYRELLHSIQHLPANDTYLFLRELIQNAYDASATSLDVSRHKIDIDNFKDGDLHVVQVRDTVGMDFEKIFSVLLIPNVSSKTNGKELGRFGVGFMSIFKEAEKVEIVSGNGNEKVSVTILPVRNDDGQLTDLEVSYDLAPSDEKGTAVRKYFKTDNGQLESAKIQASANKYGTYLDAGRVQLSFGEEEVNYPKRILASAWDERFGTLEVLEGGDSHLLQGRLYVNELPSYLLDLIPGPIHDIVLNHGLVVNIDPIVGLTRSRKDLSDKKTVLPELMRVLPGLIIEATIQKFADEKFDLGLIPYDYFWSLEPEMEAWRARIDNQTIKDADAINNGNGIDDWLRYSDRRLFLELLTLVKFVNVGGVKRSLQEINDMRKQGYDFAQEKLPKRLEDLLKESKAHTEREIRLKKEFEERQETEFEIRVLNNELYDKLKNTSDGHLAFLDVIDTLTSIEGDIRHGYFNVPKGARAVAAIQWRLKAWNLLYIDDKIEQLSRMIENGTDLHPIN